MSTIIEKVEFWELIGVQFVGVMPLLTEWPYPFRPARYLRLRELSPVHFGTNGSGAALC